MRDKLYKSRDRVFTGVCGGIAEWLGLSAGLVRVLTVIFFFFSAGIPVGTIYILLAIFLPRAPYTEYREYREWR